MRKRSNSLKVDAHSSFAFPIINLWVRVAEQQRAFINSVSDLVASKLWYRSPFDNQNSRIENPTAPPVRSDLVAIPELIDPRFAFRGDKGD
jgi:hypothetical protein